MMTIVEETVFYAETLQARAFRGIGDTREAARWRVAVMTGVPESFLKKLRYEARIMRDVAGSRYRALRDAYEAAVEEEARKALAARAEREAIDDPAGTEQGLALVGRAPARSQAPAEGR